MKRAKQRDPRNWYLPHAFMAIIHSEISDLYERLRSVTYKYTERPVLMKSQLFQTEGTGIVGSPDIDAMAAAIESVNLRKEAAQRMANFLANQVAVYGYAGYQVSVDHGGHIKFDEIPTSSLLLGRSTRD